MARVASRAIPRREKIDTLRLPGGIAVADEPDRVTTRIDRLSRYYADVRPVSPTALRAGEPAAVAAAGGILERIIQTNDLLGVDYLEGSSCGEVGVDVPGRVAGGPGLAPDGGAGAEQPGGVFGEVGEERGRRCRRV